MAKSFAQNLRYFCAWNAMSFVRFCVIFFAQNRKCYAKCNSLGKLSKIDILRKQLKIYSIHKKLLTYEYDNDYTIILHSHGYFKLQKVWWHGNASTRECLKKRTHKTSFMLSSLIIKIYFKNYFTIYLGYIRLRRRLRRRPSAAAMMG